MKAIIYSRVAVDSATKTETRVQGQKSKLQSYCKQNNIEVVGVYEDFAVGYSFHRTEWLKIMRQLKDNPGTADCILITTWDRFSRSTAESYIMINELKKLGVNLQAIDQPLDLDLPENMRLLEIYVTPPSDDSNKRGQKIRNSMLKISQKGGWIGYPLKGYKKTKNSDNKTIMVPEGGKMEALVKRAFSEFATGKYTVKELLNKFNRKDFRRDVSVFEKMLRSKGYIGQVFVPAYKDQPATWVKGLHVAIIDEDTFYKVQENLDLKK